MVWSGLGGWGVWRGDCGVVDGSGDLDSGRMTQRVRRLLVEYPLLLLLLGLLAVFLVYPILLMVRGGFAADPSTGRGFTLHHVLMVFKTPVLREGLLNSFLFAVGATTLSMLIALPLAVLSAGYRFPFKRTLNALVLVPLILPPFVGALGMKAIMGRQGALNVLLEPVYGLFGMDAVDWLGGPAKPIGIVLVMALHLYPILYVNVAASLANLDPALSEAAENLGARGWTRFFRVTLPLIRPGIFAGGTIVFIWAFTELGTPLIFDFYRATPVQIFSSLKEVEGSAEPFALTVVLLAASVVLYAIGKGLFGRRGHAMYSKASRAADEAPLKGVRGWGATVLFALVIGLAVVPHLGVILYSVAEPGTWYRSVLPGSFTADHFVVALSDPTSFGSITNSLFLSAAAVALNIVVGLTVAYLLVRTSVRGKGLLDALVMLPLAVPGLVMALGYIALTLRWPFGDGDPLEGLFAVFGSDPNPFPLLIVAYAVRRLPYIVRSTVAGLEQTSGELEEAAVNLGASRLTAIRRVIVPLIMANIIAGSLLVFAFSMLEVSDSLLLAQQSKHYPITRMIYDFTLRLGDGPYIAAAMGVWGMALLTLTLVGASLLLGKKMGAIFRV